ncbi:MAG: DoxX family protein [Deltaproteobacteria bacterium]|nr:DoxX family protein [Deltaproteobacteria bacterium]
MSKIMWGANENHKFSINRILARLLPVSTWLSFLIRLGLGTVFIYAGTLKILDPKAFARTISRYDLIPDSILPVAAIGLPVLELLAGIGVILAIRGSLSVMLSLLALFTAVLWYGILSNLNVDCGCFSGEDLKSQAGLWQAFYRDLIMMGGVIVLYGSRWLKFDRKIPVPLWRK